MAKHKEEDETEVSPVAYSHKSKTIDPITDLFGNGDLNILRDKINEIIANR